MKTLSILGTAAMFLVGGGIIAHGIPWLHHFITHSKESMQHGGGFPSILAAVTEPALNGIVGLIGGTLALIVFAAFQKLRGKSDAH